MLRSIVLGLVSVALASASSAQAPRLASLADFVGTYRESVGHTLELVAGDLLYAVIDEAKYPLRRVSSDVFLNGSGDTITFPRNRSGIVTGYVERGVQHARIRRSVAATSLALASPRPLGTASAYRYRVPVDRHDGIPVGDIRNSDLDVATAERVVAGVLDGTYKDVHGVLLFQHGKLVLEEYFYGYDVSRPHQLRSATKSIVSALAGIAVDRGAIPGVSAPVLPMLGNPQLANADPRKAQITLKQLLSMRSGLACNDYDPRSPGRETALYESPDWVKATLDLPMVADTGSEAHYCSGGVAVTGRIVERATRMPLPAFAHAALFSPLGIPRSHWRWNYTLDNSNREFAQIHLRPRDMLKIGMVYANDGMWRKTRVISESWVTASLAEQSQIDGTRYGYFWWGPWLNVETPAGAKRVNLNAAQGNGGQKIYLVPDLDLVAVFTGGDYNSGGSPPNRIMARDILPTLLKARASR